MIYKLISSFKKLKILTNWAKKKQKVLAPPNADLVPKAFNPSEIPFSKFPKK